MHYALCTMHYALKGIMDILKTIFLGLLQGLTEFLPISSSGHLVLAKHFLGFDEGLSYEIFLHLGSLVAVCVYFRRFIYRLILALVHFRDPANRDNVATCVWLLIATAVTGSIGVVCKDYFEVLYAQPLIVCVWLLVTGCILLLSDRIKDTTLEMPDLGWRKAIFIGLGQALAILPGLSRSGTTIFCSLLAKLKRSEAATFSFILSVPVILGANLSEYDTLVHLNSGQFLHYFIGFIVAGVSGYVVIHWLIKLIQCAKLCYFAYYCFAISLISIGLLLYGK